MKTPYSHYEIHAYIDGELSGSELIHFENELYSNAALKQEVTLLRNQKLKISEYYQQITPPEFKLPTPKNSYMPNLKGHAASIILGMLLGAGALSVYVTPTQSPLENIAAFSAQEKAKFMVHLDSNKPEKMLKTLAKAESLLSSNPSSQVEIIANYQGIQIFDGKNADIEQVKALLTKYDNLKLIACQRAVEKALEEGKTLNLLPQVQSNQPAIDVVVDQLKQGWTYIKI